MFTPPYTNPHTDKLKTSYLFKAADSKGKWRLIQFQEDFKKREDFARWISLDHLHNLTVSGMRLY